MFYSIKKFVLSKILRNIKRGGGKQNKIQPKITLSPQGKIEICGVSPKCRRFGESAFSEYDFYRELGSGANGCTYLAKNRTNNRFEVVKLYFENSAKTLSEIEKNISAKNINSVAQIYKYGRIRYPIDINYAVIEAVQDAQTFKSLQNSRDKSYENTQETYRQLISGRKEQSDGMKSLKEKELKKYLDDYGTSYSQNSFNLMAGILIALLDLHNHGIIHGDLNPGNILCMESTLDSDFYENNLSPDRFGKLIPIEVKIIDLGTSHYQDDYKLSVQRENYFIMDMLRKSCKHLFRSQNSALKFEDLFNLYPQKIMMGDRTVKIFTTSEAGDKLPNVGILCENIMRFLCVSTLLMGYAESKRRDPGSDKWVSTFDYDEYSELINIIHFGKLQDSLKDVMDLRIFEYFNKSKNFDSYFESISDHVRTSPEKYIHNWDEFKFSDSAKPRMIEDYLKNISEFISSEFNIVNWENLFRVFEDCHPKIDGVSIGKIVNNSLGYRSIGAQSQI